MVRKQLYLHACATDICLSYLTDVKYSLIGEKFYVQTLHVLLVISLFRY